jgi:hypothetical protein
MPRDVPTISRFLGANFLAIFNSAMVVWNLYTYNGAIDWANCEQFEKVSQILCGECFPFPDIFVHPAYNPMWSRHSFLSRLKALLVTSDQYFAELLLVLGSPERRRAQLRCRREMHRHPNDSMVYYGAEEKSIEEWLASEMKRIRLEFICPEWFFWYSADELDLLAKCFLYADSALLPNLNKRLGNLQAPGSSNHPYYRAFQDGKTLPVEEDKTAVREARSRPSNSMTSRLSKALSARLTASQRLATSAPPELETLAQRYTALFINEEGGYEEPEDEEYSSSSDSEAAGSDEREPDAEANLFVASEQRPHTENNPLGENPFAKKPFEDLL